jgi:hypothetical protein
MRHMTRSVNDTTHHCACGFTGKKSEMEEHLLATVVREEADALLARAWTLVCAAEERNYTALELGELSAACQEASTKLGALLASRATDLPMEIQEYLRLANPSLLERDSEAPTLRGSGIELEIVLAIFLRWWREIRESITMWFHPRRSPT